MQMILNELSLIEDEIDQSTAIQIFEQFINTYSEAIKKSGRFERGIITEIDLNHINISKNLSVSKLRNYIRDRDVLRRFLDMCDRQVLVELIQDESEMICERGSGKGLLAAYENSAFCISFSYDAYWKSYEILCKYYSLRDDHMDQVCVYNLSNPIHFVQYSKQIDEILEKDISEIKTPKQLIDNLENLFPSLIFHDVALKQLKSEVQVCHVQTLYKKLMCLQKYFSEWNGEQFDETAFPAKSVTPQSKETLKRFKVEHTFSFKDEQVIVSYHMRYTGKIPGRIYFHPSGKLKKAYICSLTTKLPTVSEPKMHI